MCRYVLGLVCLLGVACQKPDRITDLEPGLIENQTFNKTVLVDGHEYDYTVFRNCTFVNIEGDGIQIRDANGVKIQDCTFENITRNAIRFRNSGTSEGTSIIGNDFRDIGHNGILGPEGHVNAYIAGNDFARIGTDGSGSLAGAPHHGIYWQGKGVDVYSNQIADVINDDGNGISIRTAGYLRQNRISNCKDHGISYFADHLGHDDTLWIENNFIYANGGRAVQLSSSGTPQNHIAAAVVRFNTMASDDKATIGLQDDLAGVDVHLIGNILVRPQGNWVFTNLRYNNEYNLTVRDGQTLNVVNYEARDFQLLPGSPAIGYATGASSFPAKDYWGRMRMASRLDAGACTPR